MFDSLTNVAASGQRVSITRFDFLLSNLSLRRMDGTWIGQTNWFAFVSAREGRTSFQVRDLPNGQYDKLRFQIGLRPEINHGDAAEYPANHALNPEVNGLHWSWMGGYVFLALEGGWLRPDGKQSGYSFHLATDRHLMTVELSLALELSSDCELHIALNVAQILAAPNRITLSEETATTHSRTNDLLAAELCRNLEQAFAVERVAPASVTQLPAASRQRLEIAPNARPYRLTISALFPRPALPTDNPLTEEGVELGRRLFFEPRLSVNNAQSCATCHEPALAFCENKAVSAGAEGKIGTRNAMPLFNLAWRSAFFWDGRAATLREQVLQPIQNSIEMHENLTNVVKKLQNPNSQLQRTSKAKNTRANNREGFEPRVEDFSGARSLGFEACLEDYATLFERAFGSREITAERIARALEQFLLTQVSHDSKFDRVLKGQAQFTSEEQRGFELFHTEYDPRHEQFGADCFHCHGGPLFQSQTFANNGLDAAPKDLGRFLVTGKEGDKGKFAVPSLRNVELTGPYMHDGRFGGLEEVVEHYASGVKRSATLDPNLAKHPDGGVPLSAEDKRALVAFLKALTDERFRANPKEFAKTL